MFLCLLLIFMFSGTEAAELLTLKKSFRSLNEDCCKSTNLLSCENVDVDSSALHNGDDLTMPGGVTVSFSSSIDPNGYFYTNGVGDEVLITYNHENEHMFGSMKTSSGKSYAIEKCERTHVWQQFSTESFIDDEPVYLTDSTPTIQIPPIRSLQDSLSLDTTSMGIYSVMIYYTPEFEAITPDIGGFIDQVLAETNQGYANSKVPITIKKHCIERATISDMERATDLLDAFKDMKPIADLRNTADAAVLLAADFDACGKAYLTTVFTGYTLSITQKTCAFGYFSFGHELGHNFGLYHNKEVTTNPNYEHGHGHLIKKGSASTGYRTILAYSGTGHAGRVNYYSNPSVIYPITGTPTGVKGISNNAAVLVENRFIMAGIGDETSVCNTISTTSTTTTSTTTATTTTINGGSCGLTITKGVGLEGTHLTGRRNVPNLKACALFCLSERGCRYYVYRFRKRSCWLKSSEGKRRKDSGAIAGQRPCNILDPCGDEIVTGLAFAGSHLTGKTARDEEACAVFCKKEFGCRYWVFRTQKKKCWLKTSKGSTRKDKKAISGQKQCA